MKAIFLASLFVFFAIVPGYCQRPDSSLRQVREQDVFARNPSGELQTLSAAEHLSRAETYSSNRLFPEAREHWSKVITNYPEDAGVPKALFGIARSFMWDRQYDKAVDWFDRLIKDHIGTKEGREGLAYKGASYVRLGANVEAAKTYEQYVTMFPNGEKIDSAHLNIIDALREAGKYEDAEIWVDKTVETFKETPTEVNALHGRIRMEMYRENWKRAIETADTLLAMNSFKASMSSADEIKYLKAMATERSGNKAAARQQFDAIPSASYFGWLASIRLAGGVDKVKPQAASVRDFPVPFRETLLREAGKRKIDPRFLLAIMKQESVFKPTAKSPAGARGLLQLVYDTAIKYKDAAGYPDLQPDDLYNPNINIAIGSEYVAALLAEFGGLNEAIAASYNAGEDNAARWLARTKPRDPGIFTAEVGFAETKNYVQKVMNNYRLYRSLYTETLNRK
ncbi:MAG: transglycosylase SLT domain-containing protein [Pyrinomonadaceae bacterium]